MNIAEIIHFISERQILGNRILDYMVFLLAFLILLVFFKLLQTLIIARLAKFTKRTKTDIDDIIVRVLQTIKPPFYLFIAFYFALNYLTVQGQFKDIVRVILVCWATLQVIIAIQVGVSALVKRRLRREDHSAHKSVLEMVKSIFIFVMWVVGLLFVLSNLGVDITSLVAGLGIGGIVVALAAQNVLSDLFNSLAIYFDQPFVPGDYIVVGDMQGTVLKVGLKTTRIRSLNGEQIVIPNKDIAAARVKNYKYLEERRVAFTVNVSHATTLKQLKEIPGIIEKVISNVEHIRFDRAHVNEITEYSYAIRIVYIVTVKSFIVHMDKQQEILLGIKEVFDKKGIELAYPTREIYLHKNR